MKSDHKKLFLVTLSSLIKTALVAVLVLGLGWSLVQIAVWKNKKPTVEANSDGSITLTADDANILGAGGAKTNFYAGRRNIGWWDHTSQYLEWKVDIKESATYRVELDYALPANMKTDFSFTAGNEFVNFTTDATGGWDQWKSLTIGAIRLAAGENQTIKLTAEKIYQQEGVMNFAEMRLIPLQ